MSINYTDSRLTGECKGKRCYAICNNKHGHNVSTIHHRSLITKLFSTENVSLMEAIKISNGTMLVLLTLFFIITAPCLFYSHCLFYLYYGTMLVLLTLYILFVLRHHACFTHAVYFVCITAPC